MDEDFTVYVDQASASVVYVGRATRGSATSSPVWQILKIDETGSITTVMWASGTNRYDKIWDNRAGYSYS